MKAGCLGLILIGLLIAFVPKCNKSERASKAPVKPTKAEAITPPQTAPTPEPSQKILARGDIGVIRAEAGFMAAGPTRDDLSEITRFILASDDVGLKQLMLAGRCFILTNGDRVRVLDRTWTGGMRVRVLSGNHKDRDGWTVSEAVSPE